MLDFAKCPWRISRNTQKGQARTALTTGNPEDVVRHCIGNWVEAAAVKTAVAGAQRVSCR
jgi:hypothetical protein